MDMNSLFDRIDQKIRQKWPETSHGKVWQAVWEETGKFLQSNLDETNINTLMINLKENGDKQQNMLVLLQEIDKIEMGRLRLTERLNYILDNYK
jgi:hypothetical protein